MKRRTLDPVEAPAPDFLTVEEAAAVLRIGRTNAYAMVRTFLRTQGAKGIPALRIGRQVRVPRAALESWHGGPLTWPPYRAQSPDSLAPGPQDHLRRPVRPDRRARSSIVVEQLELLDD